MLRHDFTASLTLSTAKGMSPSKAGNWTSEALSRSMQRVYLELCLELEETEAKLEQSGSTTSSSSAEANLTAMRLSRRLTQQDDMSDSCPLYLSAKCGWWKRTHPLVEPAAWHRLLWHLICLLNPHDITGPIRENIKFEVYRKKRKKKIVPFFFLFCFLNGDKRLVTHYHQTTDHTCSLWD